jgi:hypothetical protein
LSVRLLTMSLIPLLITLSPLLYIIGAVAFWLSYKSGSLKRDFLLGLAWPITVPVIAPFSIARRMRAALEERKALRVQEQERRESELRAQEQRFLGYSAQGTAKWMADETPAEHDDKKRN